MHGQACLLSLCQQMQVLFFTRLFADVGGRSTPRIRALALTSQSSLLTLASLALTTLPGFFVYIKILHWHNDFLVTGCHDSVGVGTA